MESDEYEYILFLFSYVGFIVAISYSSKLLLYTIPCKRQKQIARDVSPRNCETLEGEEKVKCMERNATENAELSIMSEINGMMDVFVEETRRRSELHRSTMTDMASSMQKMNQTGVGMQSFLMSMMFSVVKTVSSIKDLFIQIIKKFFSATYGIYYVLQVVRYFAMSVWYGVFKKIIDAMCKIPGFSHNC